MSTPLSDLTVRHLEQIRAWYEEAPDRRFGLSIGYRAMMAHYYSLLIPPESSVLEVGCGSGELLARIRSRRRVGIDLSPRQVEQARARAPDCEFHVQAAEDIHLDERFDVIIISDTLNFAADVQKALENLHAISHPA